MDNFAIVSRKELTEAFQSPKIRRGSVPKTTILRGAGSTLAIEGAFLETTINIEGKWKKQIELKTAPVYDLLKKKLPKSDKVTIYLDESGKFWIQIDKLKVSIIPVRS